MNVAGPSCAPGIDVGGCLVGFVYTSFSDLYNALGVTPIKLPEPEKGYGLEFSAILPSGHAVRVYERYSTRKGMGALKSKWHIGGETSDVVDALRDVLPAGTRCLKIEDAC